MSLSRISQDDLKSYSVVDTSTEKVYQSTYGPTHSRVLIKLLSLSGLNDGGRQEFFNHIEYINKIKSEHVTQIVGIYRTPNTLGIVTEWMPNGSLHSLIYQRDLYPVLPLSVCIRILTSVAEGLTFLHNLYPTIMHQRLKPCNILLDAQYHAKLSDVQLPNLPKLTVSSDLDDNAHRVYMSPQRLQGHEPTTADDIYSLGIMIQELLSRKCPLQDINSLKWDTLVLRGHRPQPSINDLLKNSNLSQSQRQHLSQFINLCWHDNPAMRPTATECLSNLRHILQTFSVEESKREMDNFVNKKEMAMQDSQSQTRTVEFHIRYLDDSWLTSNRNRTQSAPEEALEVSSFCSGKKEKRSASLPVTSASNGCHMPTMGPHPTTAWNYGVSWTHVEPADHSTRPQLFQCRNCVETLRKSREVLLSRITEGHLNQLMDTMRSKLVLSKDDAENINAEQTLKAKIRKCIETCCEKGAEASRMALDSFLPRKIIHVHPTKPVRQ
ncbi:PREDICTED: receptor-interacting serine/threonine-protein kinase 2-like [Nanorana parkeri]|uniref:receptor-interacting serine/threonine-protein kinase 2-like n=1 Tax=Nanorana parkeri TaxID=125878 RepID=UPI0008545130|nr:PREDICTED: receptor-interacting serine/threonine-protein kinase 2-like [Nanorana parkeri]